MATTSNGFPYPVGTDKVVDGDNAIKALAEAVNPRLPVRVHPIYGNYTTSGAGAATISCPARPVAYALLYQGGFSVALTGNAIGGNDIQVAVRNMVDGTVIPNTTATITGVALLATA